MNIYAHIPHLWRALNIEHTAIDDFSHRDIVAYAESASRHIDQYCKRHFYTVSEEKAFEPPSDIARLGGLRVPDLLSASAVKTEDIDGDTETWASGDYRLHPYNKLPKWEFRLHPKGDKSWPAAGERLLITGVWGFGDGAALDPWRDTGETVTLTDDAVEFQNEKIVVGQTLRVGAEQMFVEAVHGAAVTVRRGVNGTEAAAHSESKIERAIYPSDLVRVAELLAVDLWNVRDKAGLSAEQAPGYQYQRQGAETLTLRQQARILDPYVRYDRV